MKRRRKMQKLIKRIREYLELSQADFAEKLGVTFATINRWENGRAIPTKLAQATLYTCWIISSPAVSPIWLSSTACPR